ncbi:MAG: sialate O-acetylesterase [Clostridia bacterium]|nr:sialate O-acetylesterase [Clostridia bacterium]
MIKINGYFTDGCVIQADSEFSIAGKSAPHAEVRANLCGKEMSSFCARADENGDFSVVIPPIKGGLSTYSLTFYVNGMQEKTIRNIVFGDVWLGAGQSNLELKLKYLADCDKATEEFRNSAFRFADLPNTKSTYNGVGFFGLQQEDGEPLAEVRWNTPDDTSAALETAGFPFLFAGEMQKNLDYPVGVFNVAVGGSNITHWLPGECFDDSPALRAEIKVCNEKTEAGSLYYEKICPLKGLAFRGVVWYLGESVAWTGAPTCAEYSSRLIALIDLYRDLFRGETNFLLMDIGIECYDEFSVNFVNEANSIAQKARKGVIRCPLFDLSQNWLIPDGKGTCHPIHLVDKREHAGRAADLCRLNFIENKPARCPEISSVEYKDGKALVKLSDCVRIFSSDGRELFGFAIAGNDGKFVAADAKIVGKREIIVSSPFVSSPARLTYGFFLYNDVCNLVAETESGLILPVLPYRDKIEYFGELFYEEFNPAFFAREKMYENSFGDLGGGAGYRDCYRASEIFGSKLARVSYDGGEVALSIPYDPYASCMAGLCPTILRTNQPHYLDRYDRLSVTLRAEKPITLVGIHFKTCDGKQFFIVPQTDGKEQRNYQIPADKSINLDFDLASAIDIREGNFPLPGYLRKKIALMQITFRSTEKENKVYLKKITPYYDSSESPSGAETKTAAKENKDKLFIYGY